MNFLRQNTVTEWPFTSCKPHADPFNAVELMVCFQRANGEEMRVPAFWAGGQEWRVRFAPPTPGTYRFCSECSDTTDTGLHGREGSFNVMAYTGPNPLYRHGPVGVAADRRHFAHADGTPFFWLADTWWMGLCQRLTWPRGFRTLTADRVRKGFTVVQIVAGLYPDMDWQDPRGANQAGFPYDQEFQSVNPAYFDDADKKIHALVRAGIVPCVVGSWGYFLKWMGVERLKRHWRYLVARWGAYPVVWCLAGEAKMPYYLSETKEQDAQDQEAGWTEIGRYLRTVDSLHRLITIHPTEQGRDQVSDDAILDFDMLQTGHSGYDSIPNTAKRLIGGRARMPAMPVVNGEVNYEGFMHGNYDEVQRLAFWICLLSGAAGHTYGANGIWQVNTRGQAYGPSPHGNTWGNRPWEDAMRLPGSGQLGLGKALLQRYRWWAFEPHQEWVQPAANPDNYWLPYAAGIPGDVRIIYLYHLVWGRGVTVKGIEPGVSYRAYFWHPETGAEHALGRVVPAADGSGLVPQQPELRDWVLVLTAEDMAQ